MNTKTASQHNQEQLNETNRASGKMTTHMTEDQRQKWAAEYERVREWIANNCIGDNPTASIPKHQSRGGMWEIQDSPATMQITPRPIPEDKDYLLSLEKPAEEFKQFPRLPGEMRTIIWDLLAPSRLVGLFLVFQPWRYRLGDSSFRKVRFMTKTPQVSTLSLCTESRRHTKQTYKMLFNTIDGPSNIYMDPAKDILFLACECSETLVTKRPESSTSALNHTLYTDRLQIRRVMISIVRGTNLPGPFSWFKHRKIGRALAHFDNLEEVFLVFGLATQRTDINMSTMEMALMSDRVPLPDGVPLFGPYFFVRDIRAKVLEIVREARSRSVSFHMPTVHVFQVLECSPEQVGFVRTFTREDLGS